MNFWKQLIVWKMIRIDEYIYVFLRSFKDSQSVLYTLIRAF